VKLDPLDECRGLAEHRSDPVPHLRGRAPPTSGCRRFDEQAMRRPTSAVMRSMRRPMSAALCDASLRAALSNAATWAW
jgi:hypothetical protein